MYEFFIDLETTGTDPAKNGIHQFGGVIRNAHEFKAHKMNFKIKPFKSDEIDQAALDTCGVTTEDLDHYDSPEFFKSLLETVMEKFISRYDKNEKFHFIAYNAKFDYDFLRQFFLKSGDSYFGSWFWFPYIDVMTMAGLYLMDQRSHMDNFKQITVANALGITVDDKALHDSSYDINLTIQIYDIIVNKWKGYNAEQTQHLSR